MKQVVFCITEPCGGSRYNWWCESSREGSTAYVTRVDGSGFPTNLGAANTSIGVPL